MDRSPRLTVVLTILMMVSGACAEDLRHGASHPWAAMYKVYLAFVLCYYGLRILEDTYLIFHTLYAYLTGKSRGYYHRSQNGSWPLLVMP
jgi:hypothetical protein